MKSRALIPACRCLIFLLWTTSLIAHWLHAVFLPIWWADLLDWRCFWPPSEFTAFLVFWSAKDRARSVSAWPWARGGTTFWECSYARGSRLLAWASLPDWSFLQRLRP